MGIAEADVQDGGFVSEAELASDGSSAFRTEAIVDIVSGIISFAANTLLREYDDPVSPGDILVITGNAAAGTYTVDTVSLDSLTVVEAIVDAAGGSADFRYPPGAAGVGVDPTNVPYSSETTLQAVLEDVPGVQPSEAGQVMISLDGATWSARQPLVSLNNGWINNTNGELLVSGGE